MAKKKSTKKTEKKKEKAAKKAEGKKKEEKTELTEEEKEEKKKQLLEKAKEMEKKIKAKEVEKKPEKKGEEEGKKKETKEEEGKKKKTPSLLDYFVKCGIHLGTKVITPMMRPFVYRKRADGLAILNTNLIEEKINQTSEFLNQFEPEDVIVVCKREAGWQAVRNFSEATGIRAFTKKYPAGIITNIKLPRFFEPELVIVSDPWLDKNALNDAYKINKKVLCLCDANNIVKRYDAMIPCNNKSNKSLGLVYWLLAKKYVKARGIKTKVPSLEEFAGEELKEPKTKAERKREKEMEKAKKRIEEIAKKKD